ncbi:restriction endonuclease subunit S [Janthinobacterium svalbardensis]|uniref:restriction endonuclease subunit S n=1 Tax=Janthinobacterium svalbardensis TaxID=368607 RepID=UPI002FCD7809
MSSTTQERYLAYKNSDVEWLGKIPSHWELTRNKDIFSERGSLSQFGTETLLTVSHITGVTRRSEKTVNMFMAETMEGYKHCKVGDLIINTMWAWMGALGTAREDGICSPAYGVYAPKKKISYSHAYFDYLYRTPNAVSEMTRNSKGIVSSRLRLYPKDFFQIFTALPRYEEQVAIAAYLDTRTSQIDLQLKLLSQKATQYRALRQAIITQAVTQGLNKFVAMKNSGIAWIGKIPEHWRSVRLKDVISKITSGVTPRGGAESYVDVGIPFLRSQNVHNDGIHLEDVSFISYSTHLEMMGSQVKPGDIVFNITGASIARTCMIPATIKTANISQHIALLRVSRLNEARFISYYLQSQLVKDFVYLTQNGASKEAFNHGQMKCIPLPLPPRSEQKTIAAYLDDKTEKIDCIVNAINIRIETFKELRRVLVNDVVTGKIKIVSEGPAA